MIKLQVFSPITSFSFPDIPHFDISVKRDDLIDPFISGNKWRKLKYTLQDAVNQHKTHLVSFGGAFSNHLLALAAAGANFKFKTTAFVRGEKVQNPMLQLCQLYGMHLIFVDRTTYKAKKALFDTHFGNQKDAYFIDEGGASDFGEQGCAEIISEIPEDITHLFCASGTGTTAAGLLKGIQKLNRKTQLHIVPVLKNNEEIIPKLEKISSQFSIHDNYHFGGYAKTKTELIQFIKQFTAHSGIIIDPVYTGKVFYAVLDLILKEKFQTQDRIMILHTGGMLGLLGMLPQFFNEINTEG